MNKNHSIKLLKSITANEYEQIKKLENICSLFDDVNLKLELDYKKSTHNNKDINLDEINEFLYYIGDELIGYLGICSFGTKKIAELNGMVHPDYRRCGIFSKLFDLAINECMRRKFKQILLLSDNKSTSGTKFIESKNGQYSFSELRMSKPTDENPDTNNIVSLRKATENDAVDVWKINSIFSGQSTKCPLNYKVNKIPNVDTFLIETDNDIVGIIRVDNIKRTAFIFGFGIIPKHRGKGYGKQAFNETLKIISKTDIDTIELDVESENIPAVTIYKNAGFTEISSMDYYKYYKKPSDL